MAEGSQPSSLTLEPNPFERSFASKAQERGSQRQDALLSNSHAIIDKSQRADAKDGKLLIHSGAISAPSNNTDNIPGIDKIVTPLPLTEQLPTRKSQQISVALPEVPNVSGWMPPRHNSAFHPQEEGSRPFDSYFPGDTGPNAINTSNKSFCGPPNLSQLAHRSSDDLSRRRSSASHTSFASSSTLDNGRASLVSLGANGLGSTRAGAQIGHSVAVDPSGIPRREPSRISVRNRVSEEEPRMQNELSNALHPDLKGIPNSVPKGPSSTSVPNGLPNSGPRAEALQLRETSGSTSVTAVASASYNEAFRAGIGRSLALESPGVFMPVPANFIFSSVAPYTSQPILSPPIQVPGHSQPAIKTHHVSPLPQQPGTPMAHRVHQNGTGLQQRGVSTAANGLYLLSQDQIPITAQNQGPIPAPIQSVKGSQKKPKSKATRKYSLSGSNKKLSRNCTGSKAGGNSPSSFSPLSPVSSIKKPIIGHLSNASDNLKLEMDSKRRRSDSGSENNVEGDEDERRKVFLERNRIAAIKCRQRKKQWVDELKSKADVYSQLNGELQVANHKLEFNLEQLRQFILAYHDMRSIPPNIATILNASMVQMQHDPSLAATSSDPSAATVNAHWYAQQSHPPQQNQQLRQPPQPPHQVQQAPKMHNHVMKPSSEHIHGDVMPDSYQDLAQQQNDLHQRRQQPGQALR